MPLPRLWTRLAPLTVVAMVTTPSWDGRAESETDDDNFRSDVMACEEAVARLDACCPDFDATKIDCGFHYNRSSGCGVSSSSSKNPAFNVSESTCIKTSSCNALVGSGVCGRAQAATPYTQESSSGSSYSSGSMHSSTHPPVCP